MEGLNVLDTMKAVFKGNEAPLRDNHILWQIIENRGQTHAFKVVDDLKTCTCKIVAIN